MLGRLAEAHAAIKREIAKVIVGQEEVIDQLLLAIFSRGHCILEGVPGLAKTLLVDSLARALHVAFRRIQFTPDLMPSDVTGTEILQEDPATGQRVFKFLQARCSRTSCWRTRSTARRPRRRRHCWSRCRRSRCPSVASGMPCPNPFFVLATQNPIEQEGTYPLPEAQQDRFMFKVLVKYPSFDEEQQIAESTTGEQDTQVEKVVDAERCWPPAALSGASPCRTTSSVLRCTWSAAVAVAESEVAESVKEWVSWGAGPRAVQYLLLGAKTRAALAGRTRPTIEDVQGVAHPVLRHRILVNFHAESEGIYARRHRGPAAGPRGGGHGPRSDAEGGSTGAGMSR